MDMKNIWKEFRKHRKEERVDIIKARAEAEAIHRITIEQIDNRDYVTFDHCVVSGTGDNDLIERMNFYRAMYVEKFCKQANV